MSIQFDIAKQIITETYDDNQDNFLTICSCLSARRGCLLIQPMRLENYSFCV